MNRYSIIVIGAGPAGFCAAISAARKLEERGKVLLLEGGEQTGRKLLLSGSGQCNFTNNLEREDFLKKLGRYAMYLKPAYYAFDNVALTSLLAEGGCPHLIRQDGKVFPASFKAEDVRMAFLLHVHNAGVTLRQNSLITAILKEDNGFKIYTESGHVYHGTKLVICTGGASYPGTGSDGKAIKLTRTLGHHPVPFRPHLSSASIYRFERYKDCAGISLSNVRARFITANGQFDAVGDLLITHRGFSGPLILDNSHLLAKDDKIIINWFPDIESLLPEMIKYHKRSNVINGLWLTHIPPNLLRAILGLSTFDYITMSELRKSDRNWIIEYLSASPYFIKSMGNLGSCMASAGGVPLSEINAKTMESRVCPGLHFAGEIMDYALPSGGFNIQMACSTGWLAGAKATASL